jgi:hypothetical protein
MIKDPNEEARDEMEPGPRSSPRKKICPRRRSQTSTPARRWPRTLRVGHGVRANRADNVQ